MQMSSLVNSGILWYAITYPCLRYLFLAPKYMQHAVQPDIVFQLNNNTESIRVPGQTQYYLCP